MSCTRKVGRSVGRPRCVLSIRTYVTITDELLTLLYTTLSLVCCLSACSLCSMRLLVLCLQRQAAATVNTLETTDDITASTTTQNIMKKAPRQTWHAGCSKAESTIFAPPQTPFPEVRDGQNLISWRWSLSLPTNHVSKLQCTDWREILLSQADPRVTSAPSLAIFRRVSSNVGSRVRHYTSRLLQLPPDGHT